MATNLRYVKIVPGQKGDVEKAFEDYFKRAAQARQEMTGPDISPGRAYVLTAEIILGETLSVLYGQLMKSVLFNEVDPETIQYGTVLDVMGKQYGGETVTICSNRYEEKTTLFLKVPKKWIQADTVTSRQ